MLGEALSQAFPDLMRSSLQHVIYALLSADADTVCGARWCHQEPQRHVQRNRYRYRPLDTRAGPLTWRSPSCAQAPTSQSGCCKPQTLRQCPTRGVEPLVSKGEVIYHKARPGNTGPCVPNTQSNAKPLSGITGTTEAALLCPRRQSRLHRTGTPKPHSSPAQIG